MTTRYYCTGRTVGEIQAKAYEMREVFQLGNSTNFDILDLLENRLPTLLEEYSFRVADDGELQDGEEAVTRFSPLEIVVRPEVYEAAQRQEPRARFTLAHELGHLSLHQAFPKAVMARGNIYSLQDNRVEKFRDAEWQADTFASRFLMPDDLVQDYDSAEYIETDFGVSRTAAEVRFEQILKTRPREIPDRVKVILNQIKRQQGLPEIE